MEDEETGKTSIAPMFSINRQSPLAKAAMIVIDECSMVDEQLGRDLMSFGTPILVLGDPGQLPPVSGGGFFTDQEPDYLLTIGPGQWPGGRASADGARDPGLVRARGP